MNTPFTLQLLGFLVVALTTLDFGGEAALTHTFLNDDVTAPRDTPIDLGHYPHECVGNVKLCPKGFTLVFTFTPRLGDPNLEHDYVLSSGAQSPQSEGFYVRRNLGKDFEVAVAKEDKIWKVHLYLEPGISADMIVTWKEGLDVYVDQILAGTDPTGALRPYAQSQFDQFNKLLAGAPNDIQTGVTTSPLTIQDILFYDSFYHQLDIDTFYPDTEYFYGCQNALQSGAEQGIEIDEGSSPVLKCRQRCAEMTSPARLAYIKGKTCSCLSKDDYSDLLRELDANAACGPDQWSVYWSSGLSKDKDFPIGLVVEVKPASDKPYIRPKETVTFKFTRSTDEHVLYEVSFGEGTTKKTTDSSISYSWSKEATYDVVVKATTRSSEQTVTKKVDIVWVEEGIPPEVVNTMGSFGEGHLDTQQILDAVSAYNMQCVLSYGDDASSQASFTSYVNSVQKSHKYALPGLYNGFLNCSNGYGSTLDREVFLAHDPVVKHANMARHIPINTEFYGGQSHTSFKALINKQEVSGVGVNVTDYDVTLGGSLFPYSGEHLIELSSDSVPLYTGVVNLQEPVEGVTIGIEGKHEVLGAVVNFTFVVKGGDNYHVEICYGDGQLESLFIPKGEENMVIYRAHEYSSLGFFDVSLEAANDVSYVITTDIVTVERPLGYATLHATHSSSVATATVFTIEVDMDATPAMPVTVLFNYGDGNEESVNLGSMENTATPLTHNYTYSQYGWYTARITVYNNISSVEASAKHQVGRDVTMVDVYTTKERVRTGESFLITLKSPCGHPQRYVVTMGDGTVLMLYGNDELETRGSWDTEPQTTAEYDMTTSPNTAATGKARPGTSATTAYDIPTTAGRNTAATAEPATDGDMPTQASLVRRRREVGDSVNITDITTIIPGEADIISVFSTILPTVDEAEEVTSSGDEDLVAKAEEVGEAVEELVSEDVEAEAEVALDRAAAAAAKAAESRYPVDKCIKEEIVFNVSYPNPGQYQIKVTVYNMFSTASSYLCPDVMVFGPEADTAEACSGLNIDHATLSTSLASPITSKRSVDLELPMHASVQCGASQDKYKIGHTFSAEILMPDNTWRPEMMVCMSEVPEGKLLIPGLTLWYGKYRITAKATLRKDETSPARKRRAVAGQDLPFPEMVNDPKTADDKNNFADGSVATFGPTADAEIYVEITKSDLVVKIDGEKNRDIAKQLPISVQFNKGTFDPDVVDPMNRTGMTAAVVCWQKANHPDYINLSGEEIISRATRLANNTFEDVHMYDVDCFQSFDKMWVMGFGFTTPGLNAAVMKTELIFKAFVWKDTREGSDWVSVKVWPEELDVGGLLDNLDDLLASGDPSACLQVMGAVMGMLDSGADESENGTDASDKRTAIRTTLINTMGPVIGMVDNYDQIQTSAGFLNGITAAKDEVTDDSKATAAGALGSAAGKTKDLAGNAPLDKVENMAGDMANVAGNVLPFPKEEEDMLLEGPTPVPTFAGGISGVPADATAVYVSTVRYNGTAPNATAAPPTTTVATTLFKTTTGKYLTTTTFYDGPYTPTTLPAEPTEEPEIPCCVRVGALCEWVEPECEFLPAEDRKNETWTNETCDEVHPDDLAEIQERFMLYLLQQKMIEYARRKATTEAAMGAVGSVGDVLLDKSGDDGNITIDTPNMKMQVAKIKPGTNESMGGVGIPAGNLGDNVGGAKITECNNPFTYSDSANGVKGKVISLDIMATDGSNIKMENMSEPFKIRREGKPHLVPAARKYSIFPTQGDKPNFHALEVINNGSSLHFVIRPWSDLLDDVDTNTKYMVYMKYNEFPNDTYYDYKTVIPIEDGFYDHEDLTEEDLDDLKYTVFPPSELTYRKGTYRFAVKVIEMTMDLTAANAKKKSYMIRPFQSGCKFWNESADEWSTEGVQVANYTTMRTTFCLANHLTSFGGDFAVPPNTIDFSTVFSLENFIEAIPVFVTVGLVLILYVALLVWARHHDKKDIAKWGAAPLEDNLPSDTYHYQLSVYTGTKKLAGTESKVSFILSGDDSDTGVRRLFDGKKKEFPSGSIYNYILSVEGTLGPLTYLRIWHDNSGRGKKKSWHLNQVQITDLQTGERFFFLCDRWMAVEEDDGMVERIIPVAGARELTAFKHLFSSSVRKKLTNDHLWVSVVSRPTRSNFSRVQRISVCVSLLFLTMITNCMFFKSDQKAENVKAVKIGPISFTLHQLFISIVSTAIVFPPSMIIVTIFRKARPKKNTVMQSNQNYAKKTNKFKWRRLDESQVWNTPAKRSRAQKMKDSVRNMLSFHQKSKYQEEQVDDILKKKKKKVLTLPHWTVYFAWFLCISSILVSAFFTVLYSMEWGREKSLDWLSTFILSFFQSVIVVQPIKVLLLAAFISCVMRKPDMDDEEETFDSTNNALPGPDETLDSSKSARSIDDILMQRKMQAGAIQPPDTKSLEEARALRMKEIAMEAVLKEVIVYFFFVMIVFFLSYQARDADSYLFAQNIKNTFVSNSPSFDSISTAPTSWNYIHGTLLPNLYSGVWYNGQELDWRGQLQMDDRQTIRVGVGRMRLQKIKEDSCKVQEIFKPIINHCRSAYNWIDDDTQDYLTGWVPKTADNQRRQGILDCYSEAFQDQNITTLAGEPSPWEYRNSLELKSAPYAGTLAMYKGGGYTFTFKRTLEKTKTLMAELEQWDWLDVRARALFIEFTLYNANVNLFGSVIMLVEFMDTGSATHRAEVKVFRLSSYVGGFGVIVIFFEVMFLIFTLYFLLKMIKQLRKEKLKYFQEFWNLLEFATVVLSVICIVMYAMKKVFGSVAMNTLHESQLPGKSGEYVNFVTISVWDEFFTWLLALVVFCATIKFIKMLKFNRRMGMLGDTIKVATKDLKVFTIIFFIYFFGFSQFAYIIFGKQLSNYKSFITTVESLFSMALGSFDFYELQDTAALLGPLFFFIYVCVVNIGLMGMFLTIIYDSFVAVKENSDMQSNDYEIVEFIMGKLKGVFGWK